MLPYFEIHTFSLGPLTIQVWGLLVASGIGFSAWLGSRLVGRVGLSEERYWDGVTYAVVGAVIGGRLFEVLFYSLPYYLENFTRIWRVWDGGMSIYGGLQGGFLGLWLALRREKDFWRYVNLIAFTLPFGSIIGRLGCFLIHDHPGVESQSWLAVAYPNGGRIDLGLMDVLVNAVIALVFVRAWKRTGLREYLASYAVLYGLARLVLDYWRVADARYLALTPAQYVSIVGVIVGCVVLHRARSARARKA